MKIQLSILFLSFSSFFFAGGGWIPSKGEGFYLASQRLITGDYWSNSNAKIGYSKPFTYTSTSFYGEYGLGKKWALLANITPFSYAAQQGGTQEYGDSLFSDYSAGIGDVALSIKRGFSIKKCVFAASFTLGIPSGNYSGGETGNIHLGHGDWQQKIQFDFSGSKNKFWWNAYTAFNNRTNQNSDEVFFGGELGYKWPKLLAILKINSKYSLFNGIKPESTYPSNFSNNVEYLSIAPQLAYYLKPSFGILAEVGIAPFLRNIYAAPSFTLGVFWDIKK